MYTPNTAPFKWSKEDIPLICPEVNCKENVIANPSPELTALFRDRAQLIHKEGSYATAVFRINIRKCATNKIDCANENKRQRAAKHGLRNVDFQILANRVWDLKVTIDPLMSTGDACEDIFVWMNLLDDMKAHKCTAQQLNKGKSIPPQIVKAARPGQ